MTTERESLMDEFIGLQCLIAELQQGCRCGSCVKPGDQHHNGLCAVDKYRVELPNGQTRQAFLRQRERELIRFFATENMEPNKGT